MFPHDIEDIFLVAWKKQFDEIRAPITFHLTTRYGKSETEWPRVDIRKHHVDGNDDRKHCRFERMSLNGLQRLFEYGRNEMINNS